MINRCWNPIWLQKGVLFALIGTFVFLVVGLVLVWHAVTRNDGIPLTFTTNHYAWTYGPTAILITVASLWKQVNYSALIAQPWQELRHGPQPATRTVLLDYIWPLQIKSLAAALKSRHFAVAASILISMILTLIMALSTTLFVLRDSHLSQEIQTFRLAKFDAAIYLRDNMPTFENPYPYSNDPVWDYLNLREKYHDSPEPVELSTAFTNYSIASIIPQSAGMASVPVEAFSVNVTCEIAAAHLTNKGPSRQPDPSLPTSGDPPNYGFESVNFTLEGPSCDIGTIQMMMCNKTGQNSCSQVNRYFWSSWVGCRGEGQVTYHEDLEFEAIENIRPAPTVNDFRLAIFAVETGLTVNETLEPGASTSSKIRRSGAVSCGLQYSINQAISRGPAFDTTEIDSLQVSDSPKVQLDNLTDLGALEAVYMSAWGSQTVASSSNFEVVQSLSFYDLVGLLVESRTITTESFDPLLNASLLQNRSEKVLTGLSQQLFRRSFLIPDHTPVPGFVDYTQPKLYTRAAVLWLMVALLVVISGFVIIVIIYTQPMVAPQSAETLAAAACTLSRSPDLEKLLRQTSETDIDSMSKALVLYDFAAVMDSAGLFRIEVVETTSRQQTPPKPLSNGVWKRWKPINRKPAARSSKPKVKRTKGWVPYSSRWHAIALIITLPVGLVVALEILWHLSQHDETFLVFSSDSSISAYAIRYSSTAAVLITSTLYNTLQFSIATISPFSALAAGGASAKRSMLFTVAGDLFPLALYKSIRYLHVGAALSLIASALGNLLTIAVSGLWIDTTDKISATVTAEVQAKWNIDFTADNSPRQDSVSLFEWLEHGGHDDEALIWGNVVLPSLGSSQPSMSSEFDKSNPEYNLAVPAIRPSLDCTELPSSAIRIDDALIKNMRNESSISVEIVATAQLPTSCHSTDVFNFSASQIEVSPNHLGLIGRIEWLPDSFELDNPSSKPRTHAGITHDTLTPHDAYIDCPSIGIISGTYIKTDSHTQSDITALVCTQRLQRVEANVTYTRDTSLSLRPDLRKNVRLNSRLPSNITDIRHGSTSLSLNVASTFRSLYYTSPPDVENNYDEFFNRLVWGDKGISYQNLLGSKNIDTLMHAANDLYQRLMVCVIDREYRSSIDHENSTLLIPDSTVAQGTTTRTIYRLKVHKESKIILQAFLGAMVFFGGLAWWCVDMRVLPRNPYPIASSMALFAGSRLIGTTNQVSNSVEEQQLLRRNQGKSSIITRGRRFRLGWWKDANTEGDETYRSNSTSQPRLIKAEERFGIDVEDENKID
ncbi:hypothetical protein F4678DRAFT_480704 [Xylaria arbuscula]|nr:hypothetical protein F4678DRAFT_480704 [Xylaria arbuscula]